MIKNDPNYKPGAPVDLNSCQTGKTPEGGGDPYAKQFAKELGADVNAPDTYEWYYDNGDIEPYEGQNGNPITPDLTKPGNVLPFKP